MSAPNRSALHRFGWKVRRRLLFIFLAFGAGAGATWYYRETVFELLFVPAKGQLSPFEGLPVFISPTEMLGMTISLAIKGGLVAAIPVAAVSVYTLLSPLIPHRQRRLAVLLLPAIFLFYLGGAAFAYFVMLPTGMKFLLHFGEGIAVPLITITAYMAIVSALVFWVGIVFQIPLVMFLLAKLRLVRRARFVRFRKYVPFAAFFLGAIITPTFDMVNQTLVSVPIIALYEVGLFLSWLAEGGFGRLRRKLWRGLLWLLRRPVVGARWAWRRLTWWRR